MAEDLKVGLLIQPVNSRDWDRYEAAAFDREPEVSDARIWEDIKTVGALAEPLGFDTLWITEHHRTPYGMCPNPLQFLAWFAARTERIELGAAIVVLPWHDPVRVAEDIAQLDHLSSGRRLRIGFGRGAAASEYAHLRIDQSTARERFDEGVEVVRAALTKEAFSYEGEIFTIGPTTIRPRPRSSAMVDDFFCAFVGESSLRAAAKSGLGMCFNVAKSYELMRADTELFNRIRGEQGLAPVRPMIVQMMYCGETEEAAHAAAVRYVSAYNVDAGRHYRVQEVASIRGYEHYGASHVQNLDLLEHAVWGTPERCLAKIRELQAQTDLSDLLITAWYGDMPVEEAERSLRLFSREVLPKLKTPSPVARAPLAAIAD
jgi:alkanesulfonate monooxygenase SsuD/methylene tetrahydromethanopterin reductase-like flavin-dependent oxidoreductase (luciferase family)